MTKSKTLAAALAALTLAATLTAFGGQAQARPHFGHHGWGIGAGFVAGTLIGAPQRHRMPITTSPSTRAVSWAATTAGATCVP